MGKKFIWLILLIMISGCVNEISWEYLDTPPGLIIVDATLTDEPGAQVVKLRRAVSSLNEIPEPVSGAEVIISTEDSSWVLTEDAENNGNYLIREGFAGVPGKNYSLQIFIDSKTYSAKATMLAGINFDPLSYVRNDEGLFHISFVANAFEPSDPAMWEVTLDWSGVPGYENADSNATQARLLFYTLQTIDVTEIFAPEAEKITFPAGTIVTQKRFSLSAEHAEFVRELLSETSWQGGMFCTVPSNVSTNLSQGATGYFAVCGVRTISFTVE